MNRRYAGQFASFRFYHAIRAGGRSPSAAHAELGRSSAGAVRVPERHPEFQETFFTTDCTDDTDVFYPCPSVSSVVASLSPMSGWESERL